MRGFVVGLCLVCVAFAARAGGALDKAEVERYVSALEAMVAESEKYDDLSGKGKDALALRAAGDYKSIIEDHGFTMERWGEVGQRVMRALGGLAMKEQNVSEKMAQSRREIRNNDSLSDTRKQQMLKMLEQQKKALQRYKNAPDKAAVAPYRDRFKALGATE